MTLRIYEESCEIKLPSRISNQTVKFRIKPQSENKLGLQVLLSKVTECAARLCVVMTSSQTVMAHNVPRKIGQQFTFFAFVRSKVQTPLVVSFVPSFNFDEENSYCQVGRGCVRICRYLFSFLSFVCFSFLVLIYLSLPLT